MSSFMRRYAKNIYIIASIAICSIALIVFLSSCKKNQMGEEKVPLDERVPELEAKIRELDQDVSTKDAQLVHLKETKSDLESQIPWPHEVQQGDNHWQIAYDFLTQKAKIHLLDRDKFRLARIILFLD